MENHLRRAEAVVLRQSLLLDRDLYEWCRFIANVFWKLEAFERVAVRVDGIDHGQTAMIHLAAAVVSV